MIVGPNHHGKPEPEKIDGLTFRGISNRPPSASQFPTSQI
jgi:hypothetical protein